MACKEPFYFPNMEVGNMFLIAKMDLIIEIISLIGMLVFIYSTTVKKRSKFLLVQIVFLVFDGTVWLLKSGFSALIQNVIGIVRNLFIYKNKQTKFLDISFILIALILGLAVINWSEFRFYELFPVLANLEFNIILLKTKKIKYIKIGLIFSSSLWAVYALFTKVFITFIFNILSFITAIISLILILKKEKKNKLEGNVIENIE
jgi:hypothetical protein